MCQWKKERSKRISNMLRIGSLFSGSGGFELAAAICGIKPTWASEVEPFPIRVTTKRFPNMKHLGDISKVKGNEIEPVDVITFGSPCQDLSVAGKRKGLNHSELGDEETTRSGLFMEAVRIIREMKEATNGEYPTFAVWENVPGAYSSNKGEDFRTVLEELEKTACNGADIVSKPPKGKWLNAGEIVGDNYSIAWRTLEAQFWGVPQRRRRIYLVADFRGKRAGKILFEREGLRGNFTQSGTQGQGTAGNAEGGIGTADGEECVGFDSYNLCLTGEKGRTVTTPSGGLNEHIPCVLLRNKEKCYAVAFDTYNMVPTNDVTVTLRANSEYNYAPVFVKSEEEPILTAELGIASRDGGHCYENIAGTLRANAGDNQLSVVYAVENHPADSRVNIDDSGKVQTLTSRMGTGGGNVPLVMEKSAGFKPGQGVKAHGMGYEEECSPTLLAGQEPGVVICLQGNGIDRADTAGCNGKGWKEDTSYTLNTVDRPAVCYSLDRAAYNQGINAQYYIVRRLTPLECCRLQGFPDWWCSDLETENPTESDIEFWREVFETHRTVISGTSKPKTDKQIIKWLKDPYSDSAIYKMWGNGIALPNALFVMQGIAEELCKN